MMTNREIGGNTLKVYLYLLRHGPSDLRDIQRGVGLSTASLASYHLGKLNEAGYVGKDAMGRYFVVVEASVQILDGYSKVGTAIVPQLFFLTVVFTIVTAFLSYQTLISPGYAYYLIVASIAMVLTFWYETIRLMRRLTV